MDKIDMPRELQLQIFYFKNKIEQEEELIRKTKELKRRLVIHIDTMNELFDESYQMDGDYIHPDDPTEFSDYYSSDSDCDSDDDKDYIPFQYNPLDSVSLIKFKEWYKDEFNETRKRPYNPKNGCFRDHYYYESIMPHYRISNEPL